LRRGIYTRGRKKKSGKKIVKGGNRMEQIQEKGLSESELTEFTPNTRVPTGKVWEVWGEKWDNPRKSFFLVGRGGLGRGKAVLGGDVSPLKKGTFLQKTAMEGNVLIRRRF